jgi:uncharacterized protein
MNIDRRRDSIANLVGMARCARNLVVIGDQMQLAQPIRGSHPGESGLSVLAYLSQENATIPEDLDIFLPLTRRMHPDVCRFISGAVYEGRLRSHSSTEGRVVRRPEGARGRVAVESGLLFIPVDHAGNSQGSDEEAEVVLEVVRELLGRELPEDGGATRRLCPTDILVVAPYNMQVRNLQAKLGNAYRVGTVDLFQGQEAPVVIISMSASRGDTVPRGIEFLFSANRLNVAISRAQSLAVIVGSPLLAQTSCRKVEQMKLVNMFCRAVKEGLPKE